LALRPHPEATSLLELETLAADGGAPRGAWSAPLVLSAPKRPSVVLVTIDAARLDHLSAYGYPRPTTPTLSALARVGARFDRATAQATRTWESLLSLQSGRYPATNGVRHRGTELPPEVPLLSDLLSAQGYETLAGGDLALYPPASLSSFDESEQVPEPRPGKRPSVGRQFARWAPRLADHPTFVWLHLENAHYPLLPTEPERFDADYPGRFRKAFTEAEHLTYATIDRVTPEEEKHLIALYDSALVDADAELGSVLAELDRVGASGNTIVVVAADHGELLGEHGLVLEHSQPYDEVLHVPLVMAWPEHIRPSLTTSSRVQLIDVAPTLLSLLGLPPAPGVDGRDLSSFLLTGAPIAEAPAFAELDAAVFSEYRGDEHVLYDPSHHPIARGPGESPLSVEARFDVGTDPGELHDLADGGPRDEAAMRALRSELESWSAAQRASSHSVPGQSALDALRVAGYVH
jgi:arylsulfatase A-like enzyme